VTIFYIFSATAGAWVVPANFGPYFLQALVFTGLGS